MYITLRQPGTGKTVSLKLGFSWLFLLLTPFYGLAQFIKGLWGQGLVILVFAGVGILATEGTRASAFVGLVLVAAAVFYGIRGNALVAKRLLIKGWKIEGSDEALTQVRIQWGLAV